jgi:hypothetical protein
MGETPIPEKIAPWGASGKPLDYNENISRRKSACDQSRYLNGPATAAAGARLRVAIPKSASSFFTSASGSSWT